MSAKMEMHNLHGRIKTPWVTFFTSKFLLAIGQQEVTVSTASATTFLVTEYFSPVFPPSGKELRQFSLPKCGKFTAASSLF